LSIKQSNVLGIVQTYWERLQLFKLFPDSFSCIRSLEISFVTGSETYAVFVGTRMISTFCTVPFVIKSIKVDTLLESIVIWNEISFSGLAEQEIKF